jgi:hypothetical protein
MRARLAGATAEERSLDCVPRLRFAKGRKGARDFARDDGAFVVAAGGDGQEEL